jgi:hypothetical protein
VRYRDNDTTIADKLYGDALSASRAHEEAEERKCEETHARQAAASVAATTPHRVRGSGHDRR